MSTGHNRAMNANEWTRIASSFFSCPFVFIRGLLIIQPLRVSIPFEGGGNAFAQRSLGFKAKLCRGAGRIADPVALAGVDDLVPRENPRMPRQSRQQIRK